MKRFRLAAPSLVCLLFVCMSFSRVSKKIEGRLVVNIDKDWSFHEGSLSQNETVQSKEPFWEKVDIPHDWRIHNKYSKKNPRKNGYLPTGTGWYRKHLDIKSAYASSRIFIEFDGVFRNSTVWVNGKKAGTHLSGYTGFVLDITDYLNFKSDSNELTVLVDNLNANKKVAPHPWSEYGPGHEGWWYEGYGIYRHVHMVVTQPVHVATWGTFAFSKNVSSKSADVVVKTTILNQSSQFQDLTVKTSIQNEQGNSIKTLTEAFRAKSNDNHEIQQETVISDPLLWSPDHPNLYQIVTEIFSKGTLLDRYKTPLGIRWFQFTADSGFFLNGKHLQLRGMNLHADYGGLGTALPDRANYKNIELAKKMGVNIIRSAHNDPSPALMRACDELGILLWAETRYLGKDSFALGSIDDMIYRDRNHPSIICWGLANNSGRNDPQLTDFLKIMHSRAKRDDPSRPTIFGCEANGDPNQTGFAFVTDIMGYNGGGMGRDDPDHRRYPARKMLISEYSSGMGARGVYKTLKLGTPTYDTLDDGHIFTRTGSLSSIYDLCLSHEEEWSHIAKRPFLAGGIMWSGIEYLGEPIGWPIVTSQFGVLDISRFRKDAYYYYLQQWTKKPIVHIFPHWNWNPGDTVKVWCYSNQEAVELFLNGKSLGKKAKVPLGHIEWKVPYRSGVLTAVAYKGNKKTATTSVTTTTKADQLRLTADRLTIKADGNDVSFITIDICDENKNIVHDGNNPIEVTVTGGKLLGLCSGDPQNHQDPANPKMKAFNGKLLAIVQSESHKGKITIKAHTATLQPALLHIKAK